MKNSETLRRSMQRFQRTSYKEDEVIKTQVQISWISQLQFCYQTLFNKENYKGIEDQVIKIFKNLKNF